MYHKDDSWIAFFVGVVITFVLSTLLYTCSRPHTSKQAYLLYVQIKGDEELYEFKKKEADRILFDIKEK